MDEFEVSAVDSEVLEASHLVTEMREDSRECGEFPVILHGRDGGIALFHDVDGGYHRSEGYHAVNLIHEVQGDNSPNMQEPDPTVEVHLDENFYLLEICGFRMYQNYPDEDYVLSLHVTGYERGPYTFSDELQAEIDGRETEYEYDA